MKRLYSLDGLRGVAALTVVLWHWQHFYAMSGHWAAHWLRDSQPFFGVLKPFYLESWAAVDLFFALSGFVFFWLYGAAIREGKVGPGKFALLRLSRLYPLQFATLILVFLLQTAFHASTGADFIFPAGDWGRFTANLFLVQQWVPPTIVQTFNGPAWTVSIEAGLYVLFFALCRAGLNGWRTALLISLGGILLFTWNWFISRGLMGFFLGGATYHLWRFLRARARPQRIARVAGILALATWGVVLIEIVGGPLHAAAGWLSDQVPDDWDYYSDNSAAIFHVLYIYTVIPVTILALALQEEFLGRRYEKMSYLGDISYSVYMLHFPLQIACALAAVHAGLTPAFFMQGTTLIAFYVVLIGLASLSYRFIEKPAQALIRSLASAGDARLNRG